MKLDRLASKLVRHYVIDNPAVDKVMLARRDLFAAIGKLAQKVGAALEKATLTAAAQLRVLRPEERERTTELVLKGQFAEIEHKYRSALVDAGAFEEETLPSALRPKDTKGKDEKEETPVAQNIAELGQAADGSVLITKEWVMRRLNLACLPGAVRVNSLTVLRTPPSPAGGTEKSSPPGASSSATEGAGGRDLFKAKLEAIESAGRRYYASGWKAQISYGDSKYEVDSDILQPVEKVVASAPDVEIVAQLPKFEWDNMVSTTTRRVAAFALDEAFIMAFESVKGIQLEKVGEKEFPCVLRARASRAFGVGECLLTPFCLHELEGWLTNSKDLGATKKYENPDAGLMDKDCITRCFVKVFSKEQRRRQRTDTAEKSKVVAETYWVQSPLFFLKKSGEHVSRDCSPLWAVRRTAVAKDVNMKFETMVFEVNSMTPVGKKVPGAPKRPARWTTALQVLTNTEKIAQNDLLYVSVMRVGDDDDEDSEWTAPLRRSRVASRWPVFFLGSFIHSAHGFHTSNIQHRSKLCQTISKRLFKTRQQCETPFKTNARRTHDTF